MITPQMKKKVVVIEDEPQMRNNLVRILEMENFTPYQAENSTTGLDLIRRENPDIILCDITLPDISGLQVLKQIRTTEATSRIPFIFLTAKGEKSDQRLGMTLGADDYLSKPFTPEDLVRAIQTQFDKRQLFEADTQNRLNDKAHFVSSVTHDLRSPLSVLLLNLDSLQYDQVSLHSNEKQELMHEMRCQITLMNRMIEDVLTFGRMEAGSLPVQRLPLNLRDLAERLIKEMKLIDGREHIFEIHERQMPHTTYLDPLLTRHILCNLLVNAIKYSAPNTTIQINLSCDKNDVIIEVTDQGVGISPDELEMIFQPYHRGTNIGHQHGSGYGLFIVKSYTTWLGGTVTVRSTPHKGSTFTVRLPASLAEAE